MKPPEHELYRKVAIVLQHDAEFYYSFRYCIRGQVVMSQFEYKSNVDALQAAKLEIDKLLNL